MNGFFSYGFAAMFVAIAFLTAGFVAWVGMPLLRRMAGRLARKRLNGGYRCYYLYEDDINRDPFVRAFACTMGQAYVSDELNGYMSRISEDRLPACVLLNWTRSIAESLAVSPLPALCVVRWQRYMKETTTSKSVLLTPDFIDLEDYEFAFIWGSVYCYLSLVYKEVCDESIFDEIERIACPKKYVQPYFDFGRNAVLVLEKAGVCSGQMRVPGHSVLHVGHVDQLVAVAECGANVTHQ